MTLFQGVLVEAGKSLHSSFLASFLFLGVRVTFVLCASDFVGPRLQRNFQGVLVGADKSKDLAVIQVRDNTVL